MLYVHIIAGLLAILAGFVALFAPKGRYLHRRSGQVFVVAMVAMLGFGAIMAIFFADAQANGIGALFTIYLVLTALLTVKRPVREVRGLTRGLALFAGALGIIALTGLPSPNAILFSAIAFACAASDFRMLRKGAIQGVQRLVRHLWRMTSALFVATASFFLGQAKVLPVEIQNFALLSIPVLTVLVMLIYWLVRVRGRKSPALQPA